MECDKNIRILIVDDFATMRRISRGILKDLGFTNIIEADDGTSALEIIKKQQIDFIISDWNMPKMTGIELLKRVRASSKYRDIPFLMVTAEGKKEHIVEAVQAKVSNYIVKPFTAETLSQKIAKIFGSS